MKRGARLLFAVLLVPAASAFLLGCPKKAAMVEPVPQPKTSDLVVSARPSSTTPSTATAAGDTAAARPSTDTLTEDQRKAQLLASRGEDIPIKEPPAMEFVAPGAEDSNTFKPVYFDYDKSNIKPEFQPVLESIGKWMSARPDRNLLIEGHCDERGTDEYNLALGERRALAVRRYLVALGVTADRVHTISYGEEMPAVPGSTEAAWAKNRRAEFKVSAQ
jgi:peptidoglycan-associated lipoprotein